MGKTIHEILDSLNEENAAEVKEELKKAADALHNSNKQLFSRAKKAEGFDEKNGEWVKKESKPVEKKPEAKKSDELDYATKLAVKAFLNSKQISHADDQEYILKEAELMKRNPDEILEMEHVKSHLKTALDTRETADGMPKGDGKSGGSAADSVEHWQAKGELPKDQALAEKVVEAKMNEESNKNTFSDTLFVD